MQPEERFYQIEKARCEAIHKVASYATPKVIVSIIQIVISALCIVGIQIVSINFNWARLTDAKFWIKVLIMTVCIFMLFRAVVNARYPRTEKRENVVKAKERYNSLNKDKKLNLKDYLKVFNLNTKIETYIASINKKIFKIDKKLNKAKKGSKIVKLEAKNDKLKSLITTEYINEHIDSIHIKYNVVYYSDFNDEDAFGNGQFTTRGNQAYNSKFNKASVSTIWCYVLSTTIITLGLPIWGEDATVLSTTISLALTIFSVITRIATAMYKADQLYDMTITKSYYDRSTILEMYYVWCENNLSETELEKRIKEADDKAKTKYEALAQKKIEEALLKLKQ